jgi:AraC-like DNA-binding protein
MSNHSNQQNNDFLAVKLIDSGITQVGIPYDTSWRILPYTVLTSIVATPDIDNMGTGICELGNGKTIIREPGTSIMIPRNVKHRFISMVRPHISVWVHWDVSLEPNLDLFSFCDIPEIIEGNNSREIEHYCRSIAEADAASLQGMVQIKSHLYALLNIILNECRLRDEHYNFQKVSLAWLPVIRYIDDHLSGKLLLPDIARFFHCSVSKLQRNFSVAFGQPLGDFIIKRRLTQASRLICNSNLSLAEVADKVGFADAFALSKSFKKYFELSPREYRRISSIKL